MVDPELEALVATADTAVAVAELVYLGRVLAEPVVYITEMAVLAALAAAVQMEHLQEEGYLDLAGYLAVVAMLAQQEEAVVQSVSSGQDVQEPSHQLT